MHISQQSETAWNVDEGSQESMITIYDITEDFTFKCSAVIGSDTYDMNVKADAYCE